MTAARDTSNSTFPGALSLLGSMLLLGGVSLRATTSFSLNPGWDQDPFVVYDPATGLGPAALIALDAVTLLGAVLLLWSGWLGGRGEGTNSAARGKRLNVPGLSALVMLTMAAILFAGAITGAGWGLGGGTPSQNAVSALHPDLSHLLHNGRMTLQWFTGAFAGVCVAIACRDPRVRRVLLAGVLGLAGLLLARALVQTFIEHSAMVADFQSRKGEFFAQRGWSPDSPMARAYERRALQNDASAWFALSNVLGSISACMTLMFMGLLDARWLIPDSHARGGVGAGTSTGAGAKPSNALWRVNGRASLLIGIIVSFGALTLSQSFGGFVMLGVGIALMLAYRVLFGARGDGAAVAARAAATPGSAADTRTATRSSARRLAARFVWPAFLLMAISPIVLPVAAVIARGLLGDAIGELSLRYRWFYMQGAAEILFNHPLSGVGPDLFQNAFLSAKPALCPEDVTSPHSVLWDFLAGLGLIRGGALALTLISLLLLIAAAPVRVLRARASAASTISSPGTSPAQSPGTQETRVEPSEAKALWLLAALVTIAAAALERGAMTPEIALTRVLGLVAWGLLSRASLGAIVAMSQGPLSRRRLAVALAPAAMALIAHAQIEVTATWVASSGLFWLVLGLAASTCLRPKPAADVGPRESRSLFTPALVTPAFVTLILACVLPAWAGWLAWRAWGWESQTRQAARAVNDVALYSARVQLAATRPQTTGESVNDVLRELDAAIKAADGRSDGGLPASVPACASIADPVARALTQLAHARGAAADAALSNARTLAPNDWRTRRALSEVRLRLAAAAKACGDGAGLERWADAALEALRPPISAQTPAQTSTTTQSDPPEADPRAETASLLRARLLVRETRAELLRTTPPSADKSAAESDPRAVQELSKALEIVRALSLVDPHTPDVPMRGYLLARRLGQQKDAAIFAQQALALDEHCRLDRVARGLTDGQTAELKAYVATRGR